MVGKQDQVVQRLSEQMARRSHDRRDETEQEKTTVLFNQVVHLSKAVEALQKSSSVETSRSGLPRLAHDAICSITDRTQRLSKAVEEDAGRVEALSQLQQTMHEKQERKLVQLDEALRLHVSRALESLALKVDQQRQMQESVQMQAQLSAERAMKDWKVHLDAIQEELQSKMAAAQEASEERLRQVQGHIVRLSDEHGAELEALQSMASERQGSLSDGQRTLTLQMAEQEKKLMEKLCMVEDAWKMETDELKSVVRAEVKARMKNEAKQVEQVERRMTSAVQAMENSLEQHVTSVRRKHSAMQTVMDRSIATATQQLQDHVSQVTNQQSDSLQAFTHELTKLESRTTAMSVKQENTWTKFHAKLADVRSACHAELDRLEQDIMSRLHKLQDDMEDVHARIHRELSAMKDTNRSLAVDCAAKITSSFQHAEAMLAKGTQERLDHAVEMLQRKFTATHDSLEEKLLREEVSSVMDAMTHSLDNQEFKQQQSHYWEQQLRYNEWASSEIYQLHSSPSSEEEPAPALANNKACFSVVTDQLREAFATQLDERVAELRDSWQVELIMDSLVDTIVREQR